LTIATLWMTLSVFGKMWTAAQMKMTYDDQYLITISEDSCVMIWKVQDREGRNLKRDKEISYAEEILITKSDLEDKVFAYWLIISALCSIEYVVLFVGDLKYKNNSWDVLLHSVRVIKARLQSYRHTGTKQNLTQNGDSRSFKVACFEVSGKAIRH